MMSEPYDPHLLNTLEKSLDSGNYNVKEFGDKINEIVKAVNYLLEKEV